MTTITQIDTSTLSNQSLTTALLVHTFTNTTRARKVFVQVDLDQIAGNGNYTVYATIQRAGTGSAFRVIPITTAAVASGITSAAFQTAGFPLNSTDVLKVYVTGLAGDTTTPDIVTRVWEELPFSAAEYTAPPTAAQTADAVWDEARADHVIAGSFGENVIAELDSATTTKIDSILEDTGTTLPTQIAALNDLSSADIEAALGTGTWATEIPWNASWDAEVQSEVQDAIEVNNLDHLVKIAVDTNFETTVHLDSVIGYLADNGTSATFSRSTDSLEAIRNNQQAGGGASLEDIIAGVQSVSGAIIEAQNTAALSIRIGDTWTQDIESLGDLTDKTVSFAVKRRASDADTAAIVFITEGTGLTRLNGAATTAEWGSITILDEVAGDIRLRLESDATSLLTSGSYVDAVKVLEDGDDRTLRNAGRTVVSAGVIADIT